MTAGRAALGRLAALVLLLSPACAPLERAGGVADGRVGRISFRSLTLTMPQFLAGAAGGDPVEISGDLLLPRERKGPVPAVVLVHSVAGVGPHESWWADELNDIGIAAFVLDSFSGRGLRDMRGRPGRFSPLLAIPDAYRALELLASHPAIDSERIALMGFSYGGTVSLFAAMERFRRAHGPPEGPRFAAFVAFYPYCNYRLDGEGGEGGAPVRIFHGTADDWTPIGPCRDFAERQRRAGRDVQVIEYPGAPHAFDVRRLPATLRLPDVPNPSRCFVVERAGRLVDPGTGRPRRPGDPCWTRGVTMGFHAGAAEQAAAVAKAFLKAALRLGPS